jgi:hypothetical protein
LLRIHAAVNKNRKEQALPLHYELAKALQKQKPANCKADDLVLVNGVPKMKEFRQDLKKAGTVSGRTRTPHGLSRVTDDIHHAAFDHEGASATGDGAGASQR